MKLKVIYGPPCSGKTTYVKDNIEDKDLVIDLDYLKHAITYKSYHDEVDKDILNYLINLKEYMLNNTKLDSTLYLITTTKFENKYNFEDFEILKIDKSKEEIYELIDNDDSRTDKEKWKQIVDKWFENNTQTSEVTTMSKSNLSDFLKIKNYTETYADLYFYGDIVSSWAGAWDETDQYPDQVKSFLDSVKGKDLNIYINSGGGSVMAGMAIYNMIKRHSGYKTVYVDGLAASIASVIALAGDKVVIPSNSYFMIHKPWSVVGGNAEDLRKQADTLDKVEEGIMNVYADNLKNSSDLDTIKDMVKAETWLTGLEASKYFNIEVTESIDAVACDSNMYEKYIKVPKNLIENYEENNTTEYEKEKILMELELI